MFSLAVPLGMAGGDQAASARPPPHDDEAANGVDATVEGTSGLQAPRRGHLGPGAPSIVLGIIGFHFEGAISRCHGAIKAYRVIGCRTVGELHGTGQVGTDSNLGPMHKVRGGFEDVEPVRLASENQLDRAVR